MPRITFPSDTEAKLRRAFRNAKKPGMAAACFWCGHGYAKYSEEIVKEHFANACPNAPEGLRAWATKTLAEPI